MTDLLPGLYEQIVTKEVGEALRSVDAPLKDVRALSQDDSAERLARTVHDRVLKALRGCKGDDKLKKQVGLTNAIIHVLAGHAQSATVADDQLPDTPAELRAIRVPVPAPGIPTSAPRPRIALSDSDLLMNARGDVRLGTELDLEIQSADRVDLLCSFIKWSGLRLVLPSLRTALEKRPGCVRVLTTTYMGVTDRRALDALTNIGAEVKVSYDHGTTRLHAKAWLFNRESGFSTAYIGSSNLSRAAMLEGMEWNVRLSQVDNGGVLKKFQSAFEQYWSENDIFQTFDPKRFDAARRDAVGERSASTWVGFDLSARPHQQQVLDDLRAERAAGHTKNLVVAATGVGKTVIAALDYRGFSETRRPPLLFLAHRRELLEQARATYRVALGDPDFGELLLGGERPEDGRHVFASVQSLQGDTLSAIPTDRFEHVVIDEFHHSAAKSYENVLNHLRPRYLLGLTATPERTDGRSILQWFDGRIASETRLWDALDQNLLCPFHYFGIGAGPDLSGLSWSGGRYSVAELDNVLTADDIYAKRVIAETAKKVADIRSMKALGFCVSINHAQFMARTFNKEGITARAVSAATPKKERQDILNAIRSGALQVVFSVDLFNEGIDIPDADTILFLRPTESATVFLQQLGRGLRRTGKKDVCTVLDFIGNARAEFRFDLRYRALAGGTRSEIEKQIEEGFPSLPSGCHLELDAQAKAFVLSNIRAAVENQGLALLNDLQATTAGGEPPSLQTFLARAQLELEDVYYRPDAGWSVLKQQAGLITYARDAPERAYERGLVRMLHLDDGRIETFLEFLQQPKCPKPDPNDAYQRMLFVLIGYANDSYDRMGEAWAFIWGHPHHHQELIELLQVRKDLRRRVPLPRPKCIEHAPLEVHSTYSRFEIMAALDQRTKTNKAKRTQGGVYNIDDLKAELLFVELNKKESQYSASTLYNDRIVSPRHFHWESQNSAHEKSGAGKRYLKATRGGEQSILLFVRQRRDDARGILAPYLFLGQCYLKRWEGQRPMKIDWELEHAIPPRFWQDNKVASG